MFLLMKMAQVYIEGMELLMLPPKAPIGEQSLHVCYCRSTHPLTRHDVYIPKHLQLGQTMQVLLGFPNTNIGVDDQFQQISNAKGLCCLCCFVIVAFKMQ